MATSASPFSPSPASSSKKAPSLGLFFWVWFALGCQSFGGGSATLTLIRRAVVERYQWVSAEEFTNDWALCQVAPGINLFAFTILIGRRVVGGAGIVAALVGLLLPSVTLTILITAFYAQIKGRPLVNAAVRGIIPASVGLGLATALNIAKSPLQASWKEGRTSLVSGICILVFSGLVVALWKKPVFIVLLTAGIISALLHALLQWQRRKSNRLNHVDETTIGR